MGVSNNAILGFGWIGESEDHASCFERLYDLGSELKTWKVEVGMHCNDELGIPYLVYQPSLIVAYRGYPRFPARDWFSKHEDSAHHSVFQAAQFISKKCPDLAKECGFLPTPGLGWFLCSYTG